jgi:osmoprotectant transport system substrate-binding protein
MRLNRTLALGASVLVLLGACTTGGGGTPSPSAPAASAPAASPSAAGGASPSAAAALTPADIKIGSDDFYESSVVAEMWAQVLEKNGFKVDRHFNIGARQVRQPALEGGQIDLVPEYVGSGLTYYKGTATGDGEANRTALQAILTGKGGGLTLFNISPGQDQNAFVVRADTATADNLSKISDLLSKQASYTWGLPADCDTNPSCNGALKDGYGFTYPPAKRKALDACSSPMAQALQAKAIDIAELCSTQPAIGQFGFKLLDDDKKTQGAENIAAEVRNDYLAKVGDPAAFQALLDGVSAKLTTDELTKLGVDIQVNHKDVKVAATDWLKANGFL